MRAALLNRHDLLLLRGPSVYPAIPGVVLLCDGVGEVIPGAVEWPATEACLRWGRRETSPQRVVSTGDRASRVASDNRR
jgi:hypothetical protein